VIETTTRKSNTLKKKENYYQVLLQFYDIEKHTVIALLDFFKTEFNISTHVLRSTSFLFSGAFIPKKSLQNYLPSFSSLDFYQPSCKILYNDWLLKMKQNKMAQLS